MASLRLYPVVRRGAIFARTTTTFKQPSLHTRRLFSTATRTPQAHRSVWPYMGLIGSGLMAGTAAFCAALEDDDHMSEASSSSVPKLIFLANKVSTTVYSWGWGLYGQLGHGSDANVALPKAIETFESLGETVTQVACGTSSSAALTSTGRIYTWGSGRDGRLGQDTQESGNQPIPRRVQGGGVDKETFVQIACGQFHMAAVTREGKVYTWGKSVRGQLGQDLSTDSTNAGTTSTTYYNPQMPHGQPPGVAAGAIANERIVKVACGGQHTLAISTDGRLFAWGQGSEYALGTGQKTDIKLPIAIDIPNSSNSSSSNNAKRVIDISCGRDFSACVTADGQLYTWGSDDFGQLGHGRPDNYQKIPKQVRSLDGKKVYRVSCGDYHVACVLENGDIYAWGLGKDGQTGHGDKANLNQPKVIDDLRGLPISTVSCGSGHTAVLHANGDLYMFGRGRDGQLGRADMLESIASSRASPLLVEFFKSQKLAVKSVACGGEHTVAVAAPCSK
eukprot:GILK01008241.1.p1 GENE.GILK01008241.1~~GILK01008241.1.p1  ORF type:complete len:504 (+),score=62.28 GILK01008241.1:62-1573(+)